MKPEFSIQPKTDNKTYIGKWIALGYGNGVLHEGRLYSHENGKFIFDKHIAPVQYLEGGMVKQRYGLLNRIKEVDIPPGAEKFIAITTERQLQLRCKLYTQNQNK